MSPATEANGVDYGRRKEQKPAKKEAAGAGKEAAPKAAPAKEASRMAAREAKPRRLRPRLRLAQGKGDKGKDRRYAQCWAGEQIKRTAPPRLRQLYDKEVAANS